MVGLLCDRGRRPGGFAEKLPPTQPPARHPDGGEVARRIPADPPLRVFIRRRGGGRRWRWVTKLKRGGQDSSPSSPSSPPSLVQFSFSFPDTDKLWKPSGEDHKFPQPPSTSDRSPCYSSSTGGQNTSNTPDSTWNWQTPLLSSTDFWEEIKGSRMQMILWLVLIFKCKGKKESLSIDVNACGCWKRV